MSDMFSAISNQVSSAWNTVATNAVNLGSQVSKFGGQISGRVVNFVSPKLSELAAKVQSLNPRTPMQNAWSFAKANPGITALVVSGAVATFVLSTQTDNLVHKYALRVVAVAALVFAAVAATTPVVGSKV